VHKSNEMELIWQDFDFWSDCELKKMKIQTELPVFEVLQLFEPLNKYYVNDRTFWLNARLS
jgi:hypothetical protein